MNIQKELWKLKDDQYKQFQASLIPTISKESIIGIRVPVLRKFAKELSPEDCDSFLSTLPHVYYDENLLHAILLSLNQDFEKTISSLEAFMPYIDNWTVCDILAPSCFKKHKEELLPYIQKWLRSDRPYEARFALNLLRLHFLDNTFKKEYLLWPQEIHTEEYYLKMGIAWFYQAALVKQWDETLPLIEHHKLDSWIHHKTIQKAKESHCFTQKQKTLLQNFL